MSASKLSGYRRRERHTGDHAAAARPLVLSVIASSVKSHRYRLAIVPGSVSKSVLARRRLRYRHIRRRRADGISFIASWR